MVALPEAVTLIILLLALSQGYLGLCQSPVIDEYLRDDDGQSGLIDFSFPFAKFFSRQQQLPLTKRIMVVQVAPVILGDMHPGDKELTIAEAQNESVSVALPARIDLISVPVSLMPATSFSMNS